MAKKETGKKFSNQPSRQTENKDTLIHPLNVLPILGIMTLDTTAVY
jgi:hypothetical protein